MSPNSDGGEQDRSYSGRATVNLKPRNLVGPDKKALRYRPLRYNDLTVFLSINLGKIMVSATLSSKFQLSIPKAIREEMQLQAGQKFAIIPKGDTIVLAPIRPLNEMRGILKGADTSNYRDRTDRLERYK